MLPQKMKKAQKQEKRSTNVSVYTQDIDYLSTYLGTYLKREEKLVD